MTGNLGIEVSRKARGRRCNLTLCPFMQRLVSHFLLRYLWWDFLFLTNVRERIDNKCCECAIPHPNICD